MNDHLEELAQAVRAVLSARPVTDAADPAGLDTELWDGLGGLGFLSLAHPERLGGGGGTLADAAVVVRACSEACVPGPIAEALLMAPPLLAAADAALPAGRITVGVGELRIERTSSRAWRASGSLSRVPWLRSVDHVVALAGTDDGPAVAVLPAAAPGLLLTEGANPAGEQRDSAVLDGVPPTAVHPLPDGPWPHEIELLGAVGRALQISGAARGVLHSTLRHVREREQFGRPLAAFQAVQQELAVLAGHVVTTEVAAEAAVLALSSGGTDRELLAATAKAETSALAREIAEIGHQLHGAIGFTREHRLGALTRRLWSWRDEHGNELHWRERLAELAAGCDGEVWRLIADAGTNDQAQAQAREEER
jgi:acyl-CoA dehydrogenase